MLCRRRSETQAFGDVGTVQKFKTEMTSRSLNPEILNR